MQADLLSQRAVNSCTSSISGGNIAFRSVGVYEQGRLFSFLKVFQEVFFFFLWFHNFLRKFSAIIKILKETFTLNGSVLIKKKKKRTLQATEVSQWIKYTLPCLMTGV